MSLDEFYKKFMDDEAIFGFDKFSRCKGHSEVEMTKWVEAEELGFSRELKFKLKIEKSGPIKINSTTRIHKTNTYTKDDSKIVMYFSS